MAWARRRCRAFVEATAPLLAEAVGFERFVSFPRYLASVEEALDPASVAGLWARYSRVSSPPSSV